MTIDANERRALLQLTLAKGWGPALIGRALTAFGSPSATLCAEPDELEAKIEGVGAMRARALRDAADAAAPAADKELARAAELGAEVVTILDEDRYPPLLAPLPDAPPVLYTRGRLDPQRDRFAVAIVGSRRATTYGAEQARRFSAFLAQSGLTIVSGGARGIDSEAHRAAIDAGGRTIVVAGCGLAHAYPPENAALFEEIVGRGGAIVSEFPVDAAPRREHFPRRNRIVSGMSLGALVVEAPAGSGALITARIAVEEQGRDAMAIPGRIDAPTSTGCNELIKRGAAALVCEPADVLHHLEAPAFHAHAGSHAARTTPTAPHHTPHQAPHELLTTPATAPSETLASLSDAQRTIVEALDTPRTLDEVLRATGIDPATAQAELTILEIRKAVVREGGKLALARRTPA